MAVKVYSCLNYGLDGALVEVEADILSGLSAFTIVGLGDSAVQEAKERIRSAIKNSGAKYPQQKKIINLAPAHLRKHGPHFDLPMAVGLLAASGQINVNNLKDTLLVGELALDGSVRPVEGIINITLFALKNKWAKIIVPSENFIEANMIKGSQIISLQNLRDIIDYINNPPDKKNFKQNLFLNKNHKINKKIISESGLRAVSGHGFAKRALQISAAGGHHLLLCGSPGVGKTMLAKAMRDIMPPLSEKEKIEVMQIYSAAGKLKQSKDIYIQRPFRQGHPSCTIAALYGGGIHLKPGEVSLAHRGILFLDELPEFPRAHLEQLRQPLEEKEIHISRANGTIKYPAQFTLIAGMNPCPCGYYGDPERACICRPYQIIQYKKKISGPIMDRIDLHVKVLRQNAHIYENQSTSGGKDTGETEKIFLQKIIDAREIQKQRFKNLSIRTNSEITAQIINKKCRIDRECKVILAEAANKFHLSGRGYHQIIKTARTIADLEQSENINAAHIKEALQYRQNNNQVL